MLLHSLITTGGADHAVFQWKYHLAGGQDDEQGQYDSTAEEVSLGSLHMPSVLKLSTG
jgi:hypothetical protein